ncbi:MAG: DUF5996 family protein, partial [Myxococcota bacterium]
MKTNHWPALPVDAWEPTYRTIHRWMQIVGKLSIDLCPPMNHWWHSSLRFHPRGLRTIPLLYDGGALEVTVDFVDHAMTLETLDARTRLALGPESVASFYERFTGEIRRLGVPAQIWPIPVEIPDPVPFLEDQENASYDREAIEKMWTILLHTYRVLAKFRGSFQGKSSPVHFFWGAFDVAVTRFSGRPNPEPPTDKVMGPAYSHEVISHGFWFGGDWPTGGRVEAPSNAQVPRSECAS